MATSQLRRQTASPRLVVQDVVGRRQRSKMHYDKKASTLQREYSSGEKVFVKPNPNSKHKPWIYGEVVGNPAPRACLVSTPLGPIHRNHSQIKKAQPKPVYHYQAEPANLEIASLPGADDVPTEENQQSTPPIAEQNQQTDQTAVEQNQQAEQNQQTDQQDRGRWIQNPHKRVSRYGDRQGVEICLLGLKTML